ncbi:MAG: ATP-dependent zinc protease family protein [Gammaproteobacteria bacterium]
MSNKKSNSKLLIGRSEWCQLPSLNIPAIKAKIDTGAKTSAIHAFNVKPFSTAGVLFVNFDILPLQNKKDIIIRCEAEVVDERYIMSSNGQKEHRYVIKSPLKMGDQCWDIELTLSNREPLRFRLLLGREALNNRVLIDPHLAYHQGNITKSLLSSLYNKSL